MGVLDILIFSINSILPLIGLILLGYFLKKKRFISPEFISVGNKVVFRILLPVLLFCNIAELESLNDIQWNVVGYVLLVVVILFVIGLGVAAFTPEPKQKGVMLQCIFRSNFALIGIPLAELINGKDGIVVAAILSLFTIPLYNILAVVALTVYRDGKRNVSPVGIIKGIIKNPLIIGVFSGLIVCLAKNVLPLENVHFDISAFSFIQTTLKYLARAATPLALLVLGGQFEFTRIKGYRKQIIVAVFGRTVLAPMIGVGIAAVLTNAGLLNFSPAVFAALISLFGTPVAVSSAIMAEEMNNDGQLAAQLVVWSSLISMFTLFAIIFASRALGVI